ncbi:MAG TPA: hypothetical protein VG649_01340 [Candidatus Angelobacter sp.]|jgi:hypothetical protein|nr:hypothetical protein [Candidatus Angelobacter sp.]
MNTSMGGLYRAAALAVLGVFLFPQTSYAGKDQKLVKNYGLIFGTAYGPDDHPLYGVKVEVHPLGKKSPHWELVSDHRGEFAQRVPPGPGDYVVNGTAEIVPIEDGAPNAHKKKRLKAEVRVHIVSEERQDISLHLTE